MPKVQHYQFPYVKFHGNFYPLIPLTLHHKKKSVKTFALVDSGASVSMFRPEIAHALRLPKAGREGIRLGTANGKVDIGVAKIGVEVEQTKFSAKIGFSETYAASFNILGRESFFHHFSICFNEMMRTVVLVPLRSL